MSTMYALELSLFLNNIGRPSSVADAAAMMRVHPNALMQNGSASNVIMSSFFVCIKRKEKRLKMKD